MVCPAPVAAAGQHCTTVAASLADVKRRFAGFTNAECDLVLRMNCSGLKVRARSMQGTCVNFEWSSLDQLVRVTSSSTSLVTLTKGRSCSYLCGSAPCSGATRPRAWSEKVQAPETLQCQCDSGLQGETSRLFMQHPGSTIIIARTLCLNSLNELHTAVQFIPLGCCWQQHRCYMPAQRQHHVDVTTTA